MKPSWSLWNKVADEITAGCAVALGARREDLARSLVFEPPEIVIKKTPRFEGPALPVVRLEPAALSTKDILELVQLKRNPGIESTASV